MTGWKSIESLDVYWTYLVTLVEFGEAIEAISIFIVTMWMIKKMAMVTVLKKIRVVEMKFSLIAAIIENLVM